MKGPARSSVLLSRSTTRKQKCAMVRSGSTRRTFLKRAGSASVATQMGGVAFLTSDALAAPSASGRVTVTMAGRDLGIDKYGFRTNVQRPPGANGNSYEWIHGVTDSSPALDWTLPHDVVDDAGQPIPENDPWPNYWTMVVEVDPPSAVNDITFHRGGAEPWCVSHNDFQAHVDAATGIIRLRITAKTPSTAVTVKGQRQRRPNGTTIFARYKGRSDLVDGLPAVFYVLRPEFLKRTPSVVYSQERTSPSEIHMRARHEGQAVLPEGDYITGNPATQLPYTQQEWDAAFPPWAGHLPVPCQQHQSPPFDSSEQGVYLRWHTIGLLDQYRMPLDGIYSGTGVEEVQDTTSEPGWMAWCDGSSYNDPVWMVQTTNMVADIVQIGALDDGAYSLSYLGNNQTALPWQNIHMFPIKVAGWDMDGGIPLKRELKIEHSGEYSLAPGYEHLYSLRWIP